MGDFEEELFITNRSFAEGMLLHMSGDKQPLQVGLNMVVNIDDVSFRDFKTSRPTEIYGWCLDYPRTNLWMAIKHNILTPRLLMRPKAVLLAAQEEGRNALRNPKHVENLCEALTQMGGYALSNGRWDV